MKNKEGCPRVVHEWKGMGVWSAQLDNSKIKNNSLKRILNVLCVVGRWVRNFVQKEGWGKHIDCG